ncbi:MAG: glycerophosphodiester phosphodiesterase [Pyrinomonadaceae bacterium]
MLKKILKWFGVFWLVVFVAAVIFYISLAMTTGKPAVAKAVFAKMNPRPLVFAHRGGGGLFPENTLEAFKYSVEMGVDFLELDVHSTADGTLVVLHDASIDRTTDERGKISGLTLAQVKKLDAGYLFTNDNGATYPFRGKGISVPTLEEIFKAFPQMKFNIEPKQAIPSITKPLCEMIRAHQMTDRVIVGSFRQTAISEFRAACPEVATSASPAEVSEFLAMQKTGITASYSPPFQALQIPVNASFLNVVNKDFIEAAHRQNLQVHVWTVNQPDEMQRLIEMGADGIMTDYPDRLLNLLGQKANLSN